MSTAAHEPRRVGPRRSDSPSGSKVTPRRNAPEASEPHGLQYDSDELPVLIRLPNLRDIGSVEARPAATTQRKTHRIDRASTVKQRPSKQNAPKVTKKSFQQRASDNKLAFGGIVGGILVAVLVFVFNSGGTTPPADQDGWANEADAIEPAVEGLDVSLPTEIKPPPPFPDFAYGTPTAETEQYASGESERAPVDVPRLQQFSAPQFPAPQASATAALQDKQPVVGWPSEAMAGQIPAGNQPANLWPGEELSLEQGGYEVAPENSSGQTDFRSSMNPAGAESYRMGKLESGRQQATQTGRSSILNGNIEIPDTTRLR